MNDRELARIYFDHHAEETDRRSQRRLTELMRKAIEHDKTCTTPQCAIRLHSFLHGEALLHLNINQELLRLDLPEQEGMRQHVAATTGFVVRVYFPQAKRSVTGVLKSC